MPGTREPPAVLVVSRLDDVTADVVIEKLNDRAVPVFRLDPGDFPAAVSVSAFLGAGGLGGSLHTSTRRVDLQQVRSVYWRRPSPYGAPEGLPEEDAHWCVDQARYGLGGILGALPGAHYVNHPWRNRDAEYKPAQLAVAARCGLAVPATLVTNDPDRARRFAKDHGPVVYKPVRNTAYRGGGTRALTVWIEEVDPSEIGVGVAGTIHMFQQRLDKVADVRLTVVGGQQFAVRIDGAPGLDWRRDYEALSYTVMETPPSVAEGVRAYLHAFGLVFGAFDFGLDAHGRWWLFECNPNGQWAWFPDRITDRIAVALADRLQQPGHRHDH
ncbi:ATP-grasp ribosomal peptide maturase [Streptomyces sulfonofaciens]|uniref:ATP-grasp ribosomal peptide maturase n=1 Tax=Streptomyces sulfonofaciens TaxID=68272 RepID=A0A919KSD5_9ACTN|nr:ATP-grasp ribosomal peptide maturase [Streptomyces sulfonofaciens]GHH70723.1 ATP-grasp ribosomal peptide maturase [Streptomyces sulfonofaciens]